MPLQTVFKESSKDTTPLQKNSTPLTITKIALIINADLTPITLQWNFFFPRTHSLSSKTVLLITKGVASDASISLFGADVSLLFPSDLFQPSSSGMAERVQSLLLLNSGFISGCSSHPAKNPTLFCPAILSQMMTMNHTTAMHKMRMQPAQILAIKGEPVG